MLVTAPTTAKKPRFRLGRRLAPKGFGEPQPFVDMTTPAEPVESEVEPTELVELTEPVDDITIDLTRPDRDHGVMTPRLAALAR